MNVHDAPIPITLDELPSELALTLNGRVELLYPLQGCTSDVLIILHQDESVVIKRSRGTQYCAWLSQEHQVLQALVGSSVPAPHPYQFIERLVRDESEGWLLMDYLPGDPIGTSGSRAT